MEAKFSMVGFFEDMDEEEFESLKEEHGGEWVMEGSEAKWTAGTKTLTEIVEVFDSWGQEFEDVEVLAALNMGELAEVNSGRSLVYEFVRVA